MKETIKSFTDLRTWQEGHRIVIAIYRMTRMFPKEEAFGLSSQLRRAAVSFTSNIAEGFSRATKRDKAHFYTIALGSLTEVQNQIIIARDVGLLGAIESDDLLRASIELHKMTNGLMKYVVSRDS